MAGATTKPTKRKKLPAKFTADNIETIAPVSKILDELQHKNPQAFMFYCQNIRQRRTTKRTLMNYHFVVTGHPLNTFDEDWDGELNMEYFESFNYKSLPPKMIAPLKYIQRSDPVTDYMKNKMEWYRICRNVKLTASLRKTMENYENLNEEVVQCPKHMVDIAAHLDSDPDPYFDSPYNWYYAGNGNMQLVCIDWVDYILHSEFCSLYLTEFNKNDLTIEQDHTATFHCGLENYIFETICSSQNIVTLRTKYKIFILKLIKINDDIHFEKLSYTDSKVPYTSISYDEFHTNILYVTTLDNKLKIINLDRLKERSVNLKGKLTTLVNNWNAVIGSGRGTFTHAARNTISIYDKRSNNTIYVWKDVRNITDDITCNDISVAKHFQGSTSLYFGTDHHLFLMDLRFFQNQNPKIIQRWTHCMECVPTYLSHCNFEFNKDLICLSSQWCEDMCLIPNYNDRLIRETNDGGMTMPYRPPSILNTLNEAKQKMLCHDLYNPIDARICTAITGCVVIDQGEKYDVLLHNSLGDISHHSLFPKHVETFIEDDSAQNLHDWSASYKLETKDFEVSSVENIAYIWKQLKKVPEDYRIEANFRVEKSKFNEQETKDAFENEEIDVGLQEIWTNGTKESVVDDSSFALNLHYSDDNEESDK